MSLKGCLDDLLECTTVDAAIEAWERVAKAVEESTKAQAHDALTLKLLFDALPDFLSGSFSLLQGQFTTPHDQTVDWPFSVNNPFDILTFISA